ncbi:MAG: patatin family protein [Lachnospiraceae bacterium]|nr:patatin family protein [Lachnospiraceae bacterium]
MERKNSALILEGGGNRGVFTAGVLDRLMEAGRTFPYVTGVSAGSCNAVDYLSRQPLRTKNCMIPEDENGNLLGVREIIRQKALFDMDRLFVEYPYHQYPFDFETYFASPSRCEIVMTNCLTGKAEYKDERQDEERLMNLCRASCSLPMFAPVVTLDGVPYLDGGISDSIPLRRALALGYKRCVLVLTRNAGYRKRTSKTMLRLCRVRYGKKYPAFVETFKNRAKNYNRVMRMIEDLEARGHIFVIRPEVPAISKTERDKEKLLAFYDHGYEVMSRRMEELDAFLAK